jgi:hypothetical protein
LQADFANRFDAGLNISALLVAQLGGGCAQGQAKGHGGKDHSGNHRLSSSLFPARIIATSGVRENSPYSPSLSKTRRSPLSRAATVTKVC